MGSVAICYMHLQVTRIEHTLKRIRTENSPIITLEIKFLKLQLRASEYASGEKTGAVSG